MQGLFESDSAPEQVPDFLGVLFIGDPHLEARQPGFRKDQYCETILGKLEWILEQCRIENWLPVFLGDFFERPRENPNRLVGRLMEMLTGRPAVAIYGNHDCAEPALNDDDSLSLVLKGSSLTLLSPTQLLALQIGSHTVILGGSSYRQPIPRAYSCPSWLKREPFVVWVTHHDLLDSEQPQLKAGVRPRSIPGIQAIVNGHLHRPQPEQCVGQTRWLVPGNISRRSRHEATQAHRPQVLVLRERGDRLDFETREVPHRPADEVFYEQIVAHAEEGPAESRFVQGLAALESLRTDTGAGLEEFLKLNRDQFRPDVYEYIEALRQEVLNHVQ